MGLILNDKKRTAKSSATGPQSSPIPDDQARPKVRFWFLTEHWEARSQGSTSLWSVSIMSYLSGHKNISELSQWHFYLLQGDEGSERFP